MDLTYLKAILLGIIQGLTEFLPVSSSGHLVMLQHIMKIDPQSQAMILFDLAVHLGTVGAILIYYRHSIRKYFVHLYGSVSMLNRPLVAYRKSASIRFTVLAGCAIFTTGVFYVLFGDFVEQGFGEAWIVAVCWIITATILLVTDRRHQCRRGLRDFGVVCAVVVGLAQGFALFPGISRSGSTICAALLLGLHRRWAGEFSFLIGVPAILGATLIEGIKFFSSEHVAFQWGPTLVGAAVSGVVGLGALSLLIWAVRKARLKYFAIYCYVIAAITLGVVFFR